MAYATMYSLVNRKRGAVMELKELNEDSQEQALILAKRERDRLVKRAYYLANKEKTDAYRLEWQRKNVNKSAKYKRERFASDPVYKLSECVRHRIHGAITGGSKSARTLELVGMASPDLFKYLLSHPSCTPGMTLENYGTYWHIDHIRPCASFDLTGPAQQKECFHYTNLQPLEALENKKKGSLYDGKRHRKVNGGPL